MPAEPGDDPQQQRHRHADHLPGAGESLWFWWNINGNSTWYQEQVAGPGSTYSAPAITDSGTGVQIAAAGPNGTLWFYWAGHGSSTWNSTDAEIAVMGTYSPLWFYRQGLFGNWTAEYPSGHVVYWGMPITRTAIGTQIAATAGDGSLDVLGNDDGSPTWSTTQVAGPSTASPYALASWPAIIRYPSHRVGELGGTYIAVVGPP